MTAYAYAPQSMPPLLPPPAVPAWRPLRYAGVIVVWLGVTAVRPSLGLEIYRQRRANSPLRRRNDQSIPSQFAKTEARQAF